MCERTDGVLKPIINDERNYENNQTHIRPPRIPTMKTKTVLVAALAAVLVLTTIRAADITPAEARAIAKEAYIYGFPMVDNYRIQYGYFVDRQNPEFKAPWNQIVNIPRVYTPADMAIQTPNSYIPYSFVGMDLRAEPMVLTVPAIEKKRYFSVQLIE